MFRIWLWLAIAGVLVSAMRRNYGFSDLTEEQFNDCFSISMNILGFTSKD